MIISICRNCQKYRYIQDNYYGFCSSWCCVDFAAKHNITIEKVKDFDSSQEEIIELKDKIEELENEFYNDDLEDQINLYEKDIARFKIKLKDLKKLDWDNIKRERIEERKYIKELEESKKCAEFACCTIQERDKEIIKENKLIHTQNLDLLNTIKEMKSYSDRFQQMDLDIELDYDE